MIDTHCMKMMMLWTLMLGMVQKVLQEERRAHRQEVVTVGFRGSASLCGAVDPKWSRETH